MNSKIEGLKRQKAQKRREDFEDRAIGSLLDGYTEEQLTALCKTLFGDAKYHGINLRTRLDLLISYSYVTRGETQRGLELADCMHVFFGEEEGPTQAMCMVFTMDNGKVNKNGKVEYMGALRHKDPMRCAIGAFAMYLFWRFHINREPFPTFNTRKEWYRKKVMATVKGDEKAISYPTQLQAVKNIFKRLNILSSSFVHSGRKNAPKHMEIHGVSEQQVSGYCISFLLIYCWFSSFIFVRNCFRVAALRLLLYP